MTKCNKMISLKRSMLLLVIVPDLWVSYFFFNKERSMEFLIASETLPEHSDSKHVPIISNAYHFEQNILYDIYDI